MNKLNKNQSIRVLATTCINELCPHPSNIGLGVTVQSIFDHTTGKAAYYQVALKGAGDALTCSVPAVFNDCDLRSIANFLSKHVARYYSMFDKDHTRKLEHKIFSFTETQINTNAAAGLYMGETEMTDNGVLMVGIDRFAKKEAVKVRVIKDGRYIEQLNSRELKLFLKNNPKAIVGGSKAALNYLEQAITNPKSRHGYDTNSDIYEDDYHLMTNAHRLHCKLSEINDDKLRFSKHGVPVTYDFGYTEEMAAVPT